MITVVSILLTFILLTVVYFCGYRNAQVLFMCRYMIDQIHIASTYDIHSYRSWRWRYDVYESVSYTQMVFSFKPIKPESFYSDLSFLER